MGYGHRRVAQRRTRVTGMICPTEYLHLLPHHRGRIGGYSGRKARFMDDEKKLPLLPVRVEWNCFSGFWLIWLPPTGLKSFRPRSWSLPLLQLYRLRQMQQRAPSL